MIWTHNVPHGKPALYQFGYHIRSRRRWMARGVDCGQCVLNKEHSLRPQFSRASSPRGGYCKNWRYNLLHLHIHTPTHTCTPIWSPFTSLNTDTYRWDMSSCLFLTVNYRFYLSDVPKNNQSVTIITTPPTPKLTYTLESSSSSIWRLANR